MIEPQKRAKSLLYIHTRGTHRFLPRDERRLMQCARAPADAIDHRLAAPSMRHTTQRCLLLLVAAMRCYLASSRKAGKTGCIHCALSVMRKSGAENFVCHSKCALSGFCDHERATSSLPRRLPHSQQHQSHSFVSPCRSRHHRTVHSDRFGAKMRNACLNGLPVAFLERSTHLTCCSLPVCALSHTLPARLQT